MGQFAAWPHGFYDLGGNVADWVTDKNGQGRIRGLSAVSISDKLEEIGIKVEYVGSVISQLLQDGWASLTF